MTTVSVSRYDIATWLLFVSGLLYLLPLHLLPALVAGLLVFGLVDVLVPLLRVPTLGREGTRLLAVTLIAAIVIALVVAAALALTTFARNSSDNVPALIQRMAEIIEHSRGRLPPWVLQFVPQDTEDLRQTLVRALRTHADAFQVAGTGIGRAFVHILIGMVIGALLSLETAVAGGQRGPLSVALSERARRLGEAFRRVVFAQMRIALLNTSFTAIYLAVVLPWCGVTLPFTKTLILVTFVAGLLPILGNLISNTMIFTVSLSQSVSLAAASLGYLIVIHKLEYFLNARIIGGEIRARAWEMLLAMLVMEAAFGITGLIAAPIYYAYMKDELRGKGWV